MKNNFLPGIIIFSIISFLIIEKVHAGAWTVPKHKVWGEYYTKWNYAKEDFNATWGKKKKGNDARSWEFAMEPKLEFGVTDWLTALGSIEYKEAHYKEYGRPDFFPATPGNLEFAKKNHGITNYKAGARLRFLENPAIMSVQGKFYWGGDYDIDHGDSNFNRGVPSIGYGNNSFELRYLIGKTFDVPVTRKYKLPCYAGGEAGYIWNNRHVANGYQYFAEGGFWPVKGFLIKSELDGYKSHDGTGSLKEEAYGIWRIGGVWEVLGGDSVLRQGNKLFNIELQYGMTLYGKNTTAFQECVVKVQTQF